MLVRQFSWGDCLLKSNEGEHKVRKSIVGGARQPGGQAELTQASPVGYSDPLI